MDSIVLELQKEAMDSSIDLSELLRKAYFVAKKLKIKEFEEWISNELNGYKGKEIPKYREVHGEPKYFNQFYGYSDYLIGNSDLYGLISNTKLNNPISELEDLYKNSNNKPLIFQNNPQIVLEIMKLLNTHSGPEVLFVSPSQLKGIFDHIRKIILDWTLKLEDDGIKGEGMSFSAIEKEKVQENLGSYINIVNSQVQMNTSNSTQIFNDINFEDVKDLIESIGTNLKDLKLTNDNEAKIKDELNTLNTELESSNPNNSVVGEGLKSIRKIMEGSGSTLLTQGVLYAISKLLGGP